MHRRVANTRIVSYIPPLLLLAVTFLIYWGMLHHEFIANWDDDVYITENPAIRGISWLHLKAAFSSYYIGNYAPAQIISYMIDYSLWGMKPSGFFFTNIVLHAFNGVLYYLLLVRISGRKTWPFLAAALFIVHPVQVETVAWVSQRKSLLAMLFFLASFHCYYAYRVEAGRKRILCYLVSVGAFVLALLAKSVAVILPAVLIVYDLCYSPREFRRYLKSKIPFILTAVVTALIALDSQSVEYLGGRVAEFHGGSLTATLFTMLPVLAHYLGMLFWPQELSAWYDPTIRTALDAAVIAAGLLFVVLVGIGIVLFRWRRPVFFWYVLFFIGLLPVSQVVPLNTLMNDRYLYFPMLGAAAFPLALSLAAATDRELTASSAYRIVVAIVGILLVCLGISSVDRVTVWENSLTLWKDAAAKTPGATTPHERFGSALLAAGRLDDAIEQFSIAQNIDPYGAEAYNYLGIAYARKGERERAVDMFRTLLRMRPGDRVASENLARALAQQRE